ncbi:MAG: UDP-glucose/GDP-mannose dehydrogenase family protein [Deltaproteobacteria bacterium]|nr:MAG: UDP-glucose/GDP-mannose dehydrogenase family protein [Deltaproteobacteria bacterium]
MRIGIFGVGYVGLVTGACFAEMGNTVTCYDIDRKKISRLRKGEIPIYEPGLEDLVRKNVAEDRLSFTTDVREVVENSFIIFIAVGTPSGRRGEANLEGIFDSAKKIAENMDSYKIVVTKSTVPVGTTERVEEILRENLKDPSIEFDVANNPEFLKEGAAVDDFMYPDRIIVGCKNSRVAEIMKELYAPFSRRGEKLIVMDVRSSEMTKYAANAMLATRISFMNEIARVCEAVGADVESVRKGIGSDPRIGNKFIYPGVGFGGSCFPKDLRALIQTAREAGVKTSLLDSVVRVNEEQRRLFFEKVLTYFGGNLKGRTLGVWGIAFKPKTDDIREAPAVDVMEWALKEGARVKAYDPVAVPNAKARFRGQKGVSFPRGPYEAVKGADALLIFTEWPVFREPDFEKMKKLMKNPAIFDGRNLYTPARVRSLGFDYFPIGRPIDGDGGKL